MRAAEPKSTVAGEIALPTVPRHRLRRIVRPSRAADDAVDPARVLETNAERLSDPRDPEAARKEGIALHALLQHLSHIDPAHWDAVSARALPLLLPDSPSHGAVLAKARSILTRPELAHLYGPDSRGEVPILAQGTRNGAPITIAGRIDRLVVKPGRVLIVDYKSDALVPGSPDGVPAAYLTQMGLYALVAHQLFPGHSIEAAILWTSLETLMDLPAAKLREMVAGFTVG